VTARHIYVIQAEGGPAKIGIASNPARRIREMQTGHFARLTVAYSSSPFRSMDAEDVERRVHQILAEKRLCGEWFSVSVEEATDAINRAARELGAVADAGINPEDGVSQTLLQPVQ
jgi:predicted GIY-YIG superfamily endonuclease